MYTSAPRNENAPSAQAFPKQRLSILNSLANLVLRYHPPRNCTRTCSRQSKRHIGISRAGTRLAAAARGDDHVLLAPGFVGARGRVTAGGELGFPHKFAAGFVERAEHFILGGTDKDDSAGRDDGTTDVLRAGGRDATRRQFFELA